MSTHTARPDAFAFAMTGARLDLASQGKHPDLLPTPTREAQYLAELASPTPLEIYMDQLDQRYPRDTR